MKKLYPKSVSNILKNKKLLTYSVTEHALILQQLDRILQKILPEPLAQHCQVANIHTEPLQQKNGRLRDIHSKTLVLATSSPSWSSRLRFHVPEILKALQQDYEIPVQNIRILVSQHLPHQHPSNNAEPDVGRIRSLEGIPQTFSSKTLLSRASADLVRETADSIENLDLRNSLIRLSRHSRKD